MFSWINFWEDKSQHEGRIQNAFKLIGRLAGKLPAAKANQIDNHIDYLIKEFGRYTLEVNRIKNELETLHNDPMFQFYLEFLKVKNLASKLQDRVDDMERANNIANYKDDD